MDEVMLLKLWGISSARKGMPLSPEMQAHIMRMAAVFGIPTAEVERSVHELMEAASSRPA